MSQVHLFYLILICDVGLFAAQNKTYYTVGINELPNEVDLKEYKHALISILSFLKDYSNKLDVNIAFGLRLTVENFKHSLKYAGAKLSMLDKAFIKNVIQRTEKLLRFFKITLIEKLHPIDKNIAAVMTATDQHWTERMKQYDLDMFKLRVEGPESLNRERYKLMVTEVDKTVPSPMLSDFCLDRLADESLFDLALPQECSLPPDCMESLLNGTDFGYALAHRILMLLLANIGRNCHIISWEKDTKLIKKFCQLALRECEYIADNDYVEPDLLMEFVTICATQGYTQFLRRTWLQHVLQLQSSHGCFVQYFDQPLDLARRETATGRISLKHYVRGNREQVKKCGMHVTALATAVLGTVIRLILQSYY